MSHDSSQQERFNTTIERTLRGCTALPKELEKIADPQKRERVVDFRENEITYHIECCKDLLIFHHCIEAPEKRLATMQELEKQQAMLTTLSLMTQAYCRNLLHQPDIIE